jgi:hypothetical protein
MRATVWLALIACGHGQSGPADGPTATLFPHSQRSPPGTSGQDNMISERHLSLMPGSVSVFLFFAVAATTEIFLDIFLDIISAHYFGTSRPPNHTQHPHGRIRTHGLPDCFCQNR